MTERATIFETVQIGVETVPGTAVAALKKLQSVSISPAVKVNVKKFRPMGMKFATVAAIGKEWSESKVSGSPTYDELAYLFSSILASTTPTGGGTAKTWVFSPDSDGPDDFKTFTVEQGTYLRAHRVAHALMTAMSLGFNRDEISLDGSMLGQALTDDVHLSTNATYTLTSPHTNPPTAGTFTLTYSGQTTAGIAFGATPAQVEAALEALSTVGTGNVEVSLTSGGPTLATIDTVYTIEFVNDLAQMAITLTGSFGGLTPASSISLAAGATGAAPTTIPLIPVLPKDVSVYVAYEHADLAAAIALTRVLSVSWEASDRYGPLWALNRANASFATVVETEPKFISKLKMEADSAGMALLTDLREGDTVHLRIEVESDELAETGVPYLLQIDMATKITEISDFSDEDGVFAIEWTLDAAHDATWGKAVEVTLVNTLTAL